MGQAVSGVTTYPCLRMFPEALEEEGGLPSVSVAGEAQEYREACPGLAGGPGDGNKAGVCEGGQYRHSLHSHQSPMEEVVRDLRMVALIVPATNPHRPPGQSHPSGQRLSGRPCVAEAHQGPQDCQNLLESLT